ncbi:hypothetical protein V6Z11_D01G266800 [Gossypium hirsutum]
MNIGRTWFSFSRNGRLQITRIPLRWLIFAYVNVVLKVTFWYQFHFVVEIGRKLKTYLIITA